MNRCANQQAQANDSIVEFHDADNNDFDGTNEDDGAINTSNIDPSFATRAKIDANARRPATRSHPDEDMVLGLHAAYIVGEPQSYKQAMNDETAVKWKAAMKDEYASLIKNDTWELVDRPPNTKLVDNKWVFKIHRKFSKQDWSRVVSRKNMA